MNSALAAVLGRSKGVASRRHILDAGIPAHVLDRAATSGDLVRLLPRIYATASSARQELTRLRAALLFAGPGSALSHTTALRRWPTLSGPPDNRIHVTTPRDRDRRSTRFVVVHRRHEHELPAELVIRQGGLPTIRLDTTLVDCWGHCEDGVRRAPVIESVRRGLITADAVRRVTLGTPRLRGRAELLRLIDLLKRGCQSELEIFGYTKVFNHRSLPAAAWQWAVVVAGRRFFLDLAWPDLLLAVELDGAAYHGGRAQRERDVGRDAALAAAGWLVIRVTHARLTGDPAGVRAEIREIIRVRREQLAAVGRD